MSHVWSWVERDGCDGQEMGLLEGGGEVVSVGGWGDTLPNHQAVSGFCQ